MFSSVSLVLKEWGNCFAQLFVHTERSKMKIMVIIFSFLEPGLLK